MSLLPSPLIPLLIFSVPNPTNRLRMHPNRLRFSYDVQERIRIDQDSVTVSKNALRTCYELAPDFFIGSSWPKFWTEFPIDLRIARIDYELQDSVKNFTN